MYTASQPLESLLVALATEVAEQPVSVDTVLCSTMQSVQLVRFVQRAEDETGLRIHPSMLTEHRTVRMLVQALGDSAATTPIDEGGPTAATGTARTGGQPVQGQTTQAQNQTGHLPERQRLLAQAGG